LHAAILTSILIACFNLKSVSCPSPQQSCGVFKIIKSEVFHNTFKVWVEGLVVFTHPDVYLELNEPSVTILRANELLNYIVNINSRQMNELSRNDLQSIGDIIAKY